MSHLTTRDAIVPASPPRRPVRAARWAMPRAIAATIALVIRSLWRENMGWALPLLIVLLILAAALALIASTGPLAPFVYPLL